MCVGVTSLSKLVWTSNRLNTVPNPLFTLLVNTTVVYQNLLAAAKSPHPFPMSLIGRYVSWMILLGQVNDSETSVGSDFQTV